MSKVKIYAKENHITDAPDRLFTICKNTTSALMEKSKQEAEENAPIKSGRLAGTKGGESSIQWSVDGRGSLITGILHSTARSPEGQEYSELIYRGTGLFGPFEQLIFPKKSKFLAFLKDGRPNPKTPEGWKSERKAGNVVFLKSSKGMKPNPFMEKALVSTWKTAPLVFERESRAFNAV